MLLPKGTELFQKLVPGHWPACSYDNFVARTIETSVLFILLPHGMYLEYQEGGLLGVAATLPPFASLVDCSQRAFHVSLVGCVALGLGGLAGLRHVTGRVCCAAGHIATMGRREVSQFCFK